MLNKMLYFTVSFLAICFAYSLIEPFWLKNNYYTVANKKIPESFDNKKIVFISDIHHGRYLSIERVKRLVNRINLLSSDIIILGGDYVSNNPKYIRAVFAELGNLRAKIGVYGVLGNHDDYKNDNQTREAMRDAGIHILDNAGEWLGSGGERIRIGGVGDLWTEEQNLNPTLNETEPDDFVILVSHNPDYAESLPPNKIDLMFSGHTHGGQITFFGLYAPITMSDYGQKYLGGSIKKGETEIIITHGVGTSLLPMRFFARPGIEIVTLKNK